MATITEKRNTVLNDLIEINNDRVAGFEKALADIKDENADLKKMFQTYATQSRKFSQELTAEVALTDDDPETDSSFTGGLHRAWIDLKSLFGANDRKSILAEAERGEDAIKKAYETALRDGNLRGAASTIVQKQALEIRAAHDKIKLLRDAAN